MFQACSHVRLFVDMVYYRVFLKELDVLLVALMGRRISALGTSTVRCSVIVRNTGQWQSLGH